MWAQLIKMTLKPGEEDRLGDVLDLLQATEQAESGRVHTYATRDQADPSVVYTLVVFQSEEHARAREQDRRRDEALSALRELMGQVFAGTPEFTDLEVVRDF